MDTEGLELEDGELVEDEPIDVFETYKVLQRPHNVTVVDDPTKMGYNNDSDESTDSESDSDSDSAHIRMKRPKIKIKRQRNVLRSSDPKNDKYKIWCPQVQEDSITEDLVSCGVTKSLYQERSVESYDFTLHYSLGRREGQNNSSDDERDDRRTTNKRTNADRHNVKLRLGKRKSSMEVDNQRGSARIIADLNTTIDSSDVDVASDIAAKLCEQKDVLIRKIVDIIGKEKAIDFFHKTKKIEEGGGMLIMNGSRRRTAGGVYLWLIKNDEHIPKEKIREIFYDDKKEHTEQRKKSEAETRRQKTQELIRSLENGSEKDLPALLTRTELSTRQIAEEARLRRGEGMDRLVCLDSDRTVTNPPPSPVTDDPDHSEHSGIQRQIQDYEDGFFDIGLDVDSMEVF